ncbi:ECF transporter S component [Weissella soli]|uniref:Energy-coupling factor transport system substrate-specific component n=1 Tax=Weissella soli TaxID=155866 RepID=A0A288Q8Q6_9LACO|nr:ECF transporter S component [Weissella soli]AOT56534.1 Putative HMP/thiamine permease protein YkoE [Weissella soli]MCT8395161.1 ABC transporter permease [Weissella soli]NKY82987.1 ECF transporter S component [Weissella soli]RDL12102.1 energy-coupling factor transport system substrate-specific component [Weissella soli]GEN92667.1 cobalt ABC transporter permease [Weissella soli]
MQTVSSKDKRSWSLNDVITLAIIAIFFGVIYEVWGFAYNAIAATPLKIYANDMTLGVWIMAGPMAGVLLKKAGATTIGEILAAVVEMLLFSQWGFSNVIYGLVQGVSSEAGFALTGYKNWDKFGLFMSTVSTTVLMFIWDWFQSGYNTFSFGLLITLFIIRFISIGFFAGVLVYWIQKLVDQSGIRH